MSYGEDVLPGQEQEAQGGLFGIQFTPKIIGVLIAVAGLAAAVGAFMYVLQPMLTQQEELNTKIAAKESENKAIEASLSRIEEARANLEKAKVAKADVQVLFGDTRSLDTLVLDINNFIRKAGGQFGSVKPATSEILTTNLFPTPAPNPQAPPGTVAPAGPYQIQPFTVEMTGTFTQTQSIIRNIERLQPMIVLGKYTSDIDPETLKLVVNEQGKVLRIPEPTLKTIFDMVVIVPAAKQEPPRTPKTAPAATPAKP
ncbi:hypothetical protein NG798_19180 [Ancylothrix sp. C2]|uniref:hypothetical protein n=1 Tax=Ancylothrix sp. D3o TaxID=2953691 RepID=UPI0021BB7885|nr:hypothetical protein [Ancylothrix sp. D3o]MCT7951929.1 hypothetical protein [Ancylothrix sp. D3o]